MARFQTVVNSNPTSDHSLIKKICVALLGHPGL
jgi:hypothetical protein